MIKNESNNLMVYKELDELAEWGLDMPFLDEDGTLEAQYFNPNPINVESAKWEKYHGDLKITIVLRDQNYPGSTYSINYLPDGDLLAGEYFQAVERSTFYVEFSRNK